MLKRDRRDSDVHRGKYNGLGGKFELAETPEDCVRREVLEESGLQLAEQELAGIISFPQFQDDRDWCVFVFTSRSFAGELRGSDEGSLHWVERKNLLDLNLWEGDRIFLPWVLEERFFSAEFRYEAGKLVSHRVSFYRE